MYIRWDWWNTLVVIYFHYVHYYIRFKHLHLINLSSFLYLWIISTRSYIIIVRLTFWRFTKTVRSWFKASHRSWRINYFDLLSSSFYYYFLVLLKLMLILSRTWFFLFRFSLIYSEIIRLKTRCCFIFFTNPIKISVINSWTEWWYSFIFMWNFWSIYERHNNDYIQEISKDVNIVAKTVLFAKKGKRLYILF